MSEATLHLKMPGPACAVCGVNLNRPVSRWWLVNCWTADPRHYKAQETNLPGESVRPCGVLDVARLKTPNVGIQRPGTGPLE